VLGVSVGTGASIVRGESAEVGVDTYEEVVTGSVPVSDGAGVVEQGVQGEASAIDQQSLSSRRNQESVM
jgi:hypothetical protein